MSRNALFAFVIAAVGWGTGGIATRGALIDGMGPWTLVTMRVVVAALLVAGLLLLRGVRSIDRKNLQVGAVMGILNLLIPYVVFTFAYDNASAGFVGLFAALIPLMTAIYAHFMLPDEPLTRAKVIGLSVGFAGVLALLASGDTGLGDAGNPMLAAALSIAGVATIGYAGAFARRHAGQYDPTTVTGVQFVVGGLLLLPAMLVIEGLPTDVTNLGWSLILYMGIASTFMPFMIFYILLRTISATSVSLIGYLVPLVALTGGILILGEQLEPGIAIGGLLIFAGMILTDRAGRAASHESLIPSQDASIAGDELPLAREE
jgi:drug/metabolite transporter (DMT)-like permease